MLDWRWDETRSATFVSSRLERLAEPPEDQDIVDMMHVNGTQHVRVKVNPLTTATVLGVIRLTQVFVPEMKKSNSGFIVNLGSIAGREAYPGGEPDRFFLVADPQDQSTARPSTPSPHSRRH